MALGLNATAYSFFNAYVMTPAAVRDPGTLYQASWENRGGFVHRFSWTEAEAFGRDIAGVFPETYASLPQLLARINGRPAMGELVTGNYFSLLGVPAFRGRMLRPSDSEAFLAGIVIITAACLVAAFHPARKAAAVEPLVALRIE